MGIEYSSTVPASIREVFDWHASPGALQRLLPPWQPVGVVAESHSLADGHAVVSLPGGVRWVAAHDPAGYDPPRRFVDRIDRVGPVWPRVGVSLPWRHEHTFTEVAADAGDAAEFTRITDRVETPAPAALLRQMFRYRHRQCADDLAAHREARERGARPSTVAVTGASGLVGTALAAYLTTGGHRVVRLVRRSPRTADERQWNPEDPAADLLVEVDAVVHLAGASIAGRFTDGHRAAIRDSRIEPTRRLAAVAANTRGGPRVFVSASAIGIYGYDRGDEPLAETADRGDGFLADVVAEWEDATAPAADAGLRVVRVRTGIVQTPRGGTLRLMRPLFGAGLGGRLGSGTQWLSWIDVDDLIDVYGRALTDPALSGAVNAVAPTPVQASEYARTLAFVLRRPALLPVPDLGPRLLLGEQGARELATASQRVTPTALVDAGHRFRRASLEESLRHQLGHIAATP
ncbi:TIGR01777 family oxidoreductase [Rhodococcus gannanensis]|uniref:TIGR01777 family oxidoreductase n=1 Tax=Rhodococcus gannanensis TaxID=1960308 RepID=A0ABW4P6J7_9NOCA